MKLRFIICVGVGNFRHEGLKKHSSRVSSRASVTLVRKIFTWLKGRLKKK